MVKVLTICAVATLLTSGCGRGAAPETEQGFSSQFDLVRKVVLEEPDSAPLTGIRNFAPGPGAGFLVVDQGRPQVRLFDSDGSLVRIIGRFGEGPGEFQNPTDAIADSVGNLFVAEGSDASVTRFDSTFKFQERFSTPGMTAYDLDWAGDDLLVVHWNEMSPPNNEYLTLLTQEGEPLKSFHAVDSVVWAVPYWSSFAGPVGAASQSRVVAGNNFFYPLHLYDTDGQHLREFGTPPPSWTPPARPESGAFIGVGGTDRLKEWLSPATIVSRVGIYRDSLVMVVHAKPRPSATDFYARRDTLLDIYHLSGEKASEDIPVPGRVLRVENFLYVLESLPPEPWVVGIYRARETGD